MQSLDYIPIAANPPHLYCEPVIFGKHCCKAECSEIINKFYSLIIK